MTRMMRGLAAVTGQAMVISPLSTMVGEAQGGPRRAREQWGLGLLHCGDIRSIVLAPVITDLRVGKQEKGTDLPLPCVMPESRPKSFIPAPTSPLPGHQLPPAPPASAGVPGTAPQLGRL